MKKLLLTSDGISNAKIAERFLKIVGKNPEEVSVAMIIYARNPDELYYIDLSKQELQKLGFTNIKILNLADALQPETLEGSELIYVCGGNTFAILKRLRELQLAEKIIQLVGSGALYVGVSAGSIIAGPSIEIAGWGSEGDPNDVGLTELEGFNLTNIAVFPHYHQELEAEVEEFKNKVSYPIMALANGQALEIVDDLSNLIQ